MRNSLLIVCILLIPLLSFSQQNSFQGRVINDKTKEPIAFANIAVQNQPLGTIADDRGFFSISNIRADNTIVFSCVGYKSKKLSFEELSNTKIIRLIPCARTLSEVTITGMSAKSIIKEALNRIKDNYYTSNMYLDISYAQITKNNDSLIYMNNLKGIYKHKGYSEVDCKMSPLYSNMETTDSVYSDFDIKQIDIVTQLNYLKLRPNSFEYNMDIVYDSNHNESSYIITITHKDHKPLVILIPFYMKILPNVLKIYINCADYAITRIEDLLDRNNSNTIFNAIYYKWKRINYYSTYTYIKHNDKYLINNIFIKHIEEIYPKYGFEKAKKEDYIVEGINEYKALFNVNNVYFSKSEFGNQRGNTKEIKTFEDLKQIDEFKVLLMDNKEYMFQ